MVDPKIETLLAVAKVKNYTKAAEFLHLTQPTITNHIKGLEECYSIEIFNKNRRNLEFTKEGQLLYQYAKQMVEIDKQLRQDIFDSKTKKNHIKMGITLTAGESLIPKMIAQYGKEHPNLIIKIFTDSIENLYNRLDDYKLDVIITEGPVRLNGYKSVLLDTDHLTLILSPNHFLAGQGIIELSELKQEKWIMRSLGSSTRQLFESYLIGMGESLEELQIIMEIDNVAAIKELVSMNYGVSLLGLSACREEINSGKLISKPIENVQLSRNINLIYKNKFQNTKILEDMREIYNNFMYRNNY